MKSLMCLASALLAKKRATLSRASLSGFQFVAEVQSEPQFDRFYDAIACADLSHLDMIYRIFLHDIHQVAVVYPTSQVPQSFNILRS